MHDRRGNRPVVLRHFAERIKKHFRASDICCRYGGEEFLLVLSNASNKDGLERANEIREIVAGHAFVLGRSVVNVTASFGVASYPQHGDTRDVLVSAADKALYKAKNDGRNRVESFTGMPQIQPGLPDDRKEDLS
jgi:diguanylate cyclase (GGDEF)-like protein